MDFGPFAMSSKVLRKAAGVVAQPDLAGLTGTRIRILLVDDHHLVRAGLRLILEEDDSIEVVGEASTGDEAVAMDDELRPDMVVLDVRMPGLGAFEAVRRIRAMHPRTQVIMLTMYDTQQHVAKAMQVGAAGYLTKDASPELVLNTIHTVASGGIVLRKGRAPRREILGHPSPHAPGESRMREPLTSRELEILGLVSRGYLNKEIARELNLADITVKKYVQSIMAKLGATNRTEAAVMGVRCGLLSSEEASRSSPLDTEGEE